MTQPPNPADLDELRRLAEAATPGLWKPVVSDYVDGGLELRDRLLLTGDEESSIYSNYPPGTPEGDRADASLALIAAMRNALPQLLTAAEENAGLRTALANEQALTKRLSEAMSNECTLLLGENDRLRERVTELEGAIGRLIEHTEACHLWLYMDCAPHGDDAKELTEELREARAVLEKGKA